MNEHNIPDLVPHPGPGPDDPRLAEAVREAFGDSCPDHLTDQILVTVREQEQSLRTWQARWLFAIPVIEVLPLVLLRSEVASFVGTAAQLWTAIRDAAAPSCLGCLAWLSSCWQAAGALLTMAAPQPLDLVPWVCAALVAATSSGALVLRMERPHA
jgi:hypothetical protein